MIIFSSHCDQFWQLSRVRSKQFRVNVIFNLISLDKNARALCRSCEFSDPSTSTFSTRKINVVILFTHSFAYRVRHLVINYQNKMGNCQQQLTSVGNRERRVIHHPSSAMRWILDMAQVHELGFPTCATLQRISFTHFRISIWVWIFSNHRIGDSFDLTAPALIQSVADEIVTKFQIAFISVRRLLHHLKVVHVRNRFLSLPFSVYVKQKYEKTAYAYLKVVVDDDVHKQT